MDTYAVAYAPQGARREEPATLQAEIPGCIVVAYPIGPGVMKSQTFPSWDTGLDFAGKLGTGYVIFDALTGVWKIKEQASS